MDSSAPSFPKTPTLPSRETSRFTEEEQVERFKRAMGFYDAPVPGISNTYALADLERLGAGNLAGFKGGKSYMGPPGANTLRRRALAAEQKAKRNELAAQDKFELSNDKEKARLAQTFRPVSDDEAEGACKKREVDHDRETERKTEGEHRGHKRHGLAKKLGKMFGNGGSGK